MARQGMVLKIERQVMTVMTEDGEFRQYPVPKVIPALGSTVTLRAPSSAKRPWQMAMVAVLLLVFLGAGVFRPLLLPSAVAAVTFDLPIELELGVDEANRIVQVKAGDDYSRNLAKTLKLKGQDVYAAADQLVQAACGGMSCPPQAGEQAFMVTIMPLKGRDKMNLDRQRLQEQMRQELHRQAFDGYLIVEESTEDLRQKAAQMGLPVAKYLLWARHQGEAAEFRNIEELQTLPINSFIPHDEQALEQRFPGKWCRVGGTGAAAPGRPPMGAGGHRGPMYNNMHQGRH